RSRSHGRDRAVDCPCRPAGAGPREGGRMNERREPDYKNTVAILSPRGRGDEQARSYRSVVWGLFLVALGVAFLLDRMGMLRVGNIGDLWPIVLFVIAVTHIAERRYPAAVMFVTLGLVFSAINFGWMGLTYHNGWPLLMIAAGMGMVVKALIGDRPRREREPGEEGVSH